MNWFNTVSASVLSLLPKWMVRPFAAPYVAGEEVDDAIETVRTLNRQGYTTTLDILGEHVQSIEEAESITHAYCELYDRIAESEIDANISLKLTHLGLEIDPNLAQRNVDTILSKTRAHDNFLRLDMENSPYTDETLGIYSHALNVYPQVGTVLQAYLHRTLEDIRTLNQPAFNVRICKGIYKESPEIAYQDREAIRDNFIRAVQEVLDGEGYVAIATHDIYLIDTLETWLENKNIPENRFEFQVLYGVPMGNRLERLLERGHNVRIYVPFGEAWFEYSIRRLKENPNIIGYVLGNLFKR